MRRRNMRRRPLSEINVVPYVDVTLVLLVIFMITAPLLSQGVNVNLPRAQAKVLNAHQPEPIILSVDAHGKYYLNVAKHPDIPMAATTVLTRVAAEIQLAQQENKHRAVMVRGDRYVDYGKIMQAMVLLQRAGAKSVGLMTRSPNPHHHA